MAPQFVKPYVKSNKNDANDAEAICEAVTRPNMRFVPQKSVQQQDLQCQHRVRSRLVACRTQLVNQIRGLLAEYGIVLHRMWDSCAAAYAPFWKMPRTSSQAWAASYSVASRKSSRSWKRRSTSPIGRSSWPFKAMKTVSVLGQSRA